MSHQLIQADRGLSGSGPWSNRRLYSEARYGLIHSRLPRVTDKQKCIHSIKTAYNSYNKNTIYYTHQIQSQAQATWLEVRIDS